MSSMVANTNSIPGRDSSISLSAGGTRIDRRYWIAVGLCLLGCLAFRFDLPISQSMHTRQSLKVLHQPLQIAEALGDGTGVAVVMFTMFLLNVERRRELPRVLWGVLASGLLTNIIKLCVVRLRPRSFAGDGLLHVTSVWDTFQGWFPFLHPELSSLGSKYQSFPSAHTATGFALAVGLSRMYVRGWWWFSFLAVMIALQRVETGAHYLSDTCFGAAVGLTAALTFQSGTPWARRLDEYETKQTV